MVTAGFRKFLVGKAFLRDTYETLCFAIFSYLTHSVSTHTIYTHITHILRGVFFREKTLATTLESQRLLYPQSSTQYTIHYDFSQLLPLNLQILERLIAQTLTTPILIVKCEVLVLLESIRRSHLFRGCDIAKLRDPERQRRQDLAKSVGSRSLEGSSTWVRLGLEGFLLFVYSNLFSSRSIYRLEGNGEVFR